MLHRFVNAILCTAIGALWLWTLYETLIVFADNSPDMFWAKDLECRYTFANKAMRNKVLCAVDLEEIQGKTDIYFAERERAKHPDDKNWHTFGELCQDSDIVTLKKKKPQRFDEYGNIRGEFLFLDVYKVPLKNSNGEIIGTIGTARDVTKEKEDEKKRMQVEEELKISEQKFKKLVDNLNEIVYTADASGKVTYVNKAFEKLTGFTKEVLNDKDRENRIHPDDYQEFMENIAKVRSNIKVENFEYRSRTAAGTYLNLLTTIQPLQSKNGKFAGMTGVATDITKIIKAENEIISSKEKLDTILSAIPDIILILDADGTYLDIFPRDSKYLLYPIHDLLGKNIKDIIPKPLVSDFITIINKAISSEQLINYKYSLQINNENILFNARVKKIQYEGKTAVLFDAHDITIEEKIIQSLKENEQKFLNLLNYTYDWEYWVEPNGNIGYTSPSCEQQTGYKAEEYLNNPSLVREIIHKDDREKFKKHLKEVHNSHKYGKIEFKIIKKNGEMRVLRHTCQAVFEKGKFIGRRVTNRNATDRWKAEQKQKESEREYKSIFNSLIDIYFRINLNGIVENISPSVEKVSGFKREDIIGKEASSFYLFPELKSKVLESTLQKGIVQNFEIDFKIKNGEVKTASLNSKLVFNEKNEPIAIEGMLRNVTELKIAREELVYAKNEIQHYLSIVRVMILVIDNNGLVKMINKIGCKILGYSENEIVGKNWIENFVPPHKREEIKKVFDMLFHKETESSTYFENEIINKAGKLKTIRWRNTYLENSKGEVTGILSSGEDVTKETKMLHDLVESERNLKELNDAKDKFFSIVSHDIRSPFTALLGFTQILEEEYEDLTKSEVDEIIHSLRKISNKIFEFIEKLLDWSRIQSNKIEIVPQRLILYSIVQDVFVLLSTVALNKKVKINIDVPNKLMVVGDENVVNTVLRNLISNAIKFSTHGNEITIFTEEARNENDIVVCVRDNGTGMSNDIKNKLFKLEEQVSELGTNNESGTGLGLLICKDLLEKQQSKIWVESELNVGSTFKFTLKKVIEK